MIKKNIKFITTGQFVTFYNTCKGFSSDVRVRDLENQHLDINAKKLSELATIPLGLPYVLIIHGDDEKKKADKLLQKIQDCIMKFHSSALSVPGCRISRL